jgi:hypothetical protein
MKRLIKTDSPSIQKEVEKIGVWHIADLYSCKKCNEGIATTFKTKLWAKKAKQFLKDHKHK